MTQDGGDLTVPSLTCSADAAVPESERLAGWGDILIALLLAELLRALARRVRAAFRRRPQRGDSGRRAVPDPRETPLPGEEPDYAPSAPPLWTSHRPGPEALLTPSPTYEGTRTRARRPREAPNASWEQYPQSGEGNRHCAVYRRRVHLGSVRDLWVSFDLPQDDHTAALGGEQGLQQHSRRAT